MSLRTALEALYAVGENMTKANGFNLDWRGSKDLDLRDMSTVEASLFWVVYQDEENLDNEQGGGAGNGRYADIANVIIVASPSYDNATYDNRETPFNSTLQLADAVEDIKHAFDANGLYGDTICAGGIEWLDYQGCEEDTIEEENNYNTKRLNMRFQFKYFTDRRRP